jgi:hypothetical protein
LLVDILKVAALALVLGVAEIGASGSSAAADPNETYRTNCRGNDCVRFLCDEVGHNCLLLGYFDRREEGRPACNEFGKKPDSPRECENEDYGNNGPHYHYTNHFDSDNDYYNYYPF